MKITPILSFLVLSLSLMTSLAQSPSGNTNSADALILEAENKVDTLTAGQTTWIPAKTNQVLRFKDRIRTGFKSRATLRLSNQGILRVNQLTTLEIQPPEDPTKSQSVLDVQGGKAYFFNRDEPVETQFRTPQASGAIRGTEFNIEVADDGKTIVTLLDGAVDLSNEHGQVSLTSGEQGIVEAGKAPSKSAVIDAINIIQWSLYYPAVLDTSELRLAAQASEPLGASLNAYQQGDLLAAVALFPTNGVTETGPAGVYSAALHLAVGQVDAAQSLLSNAGNADGQLSVFANALRQMIAAVKFQEWNLTNAPQTATEWMAQSYYHQSRSRLEEARHAARMATEKSPEFGFAWARLAEMEFSFGRTDAAAEALEKGLKLTTRNAQALALNGFLLAAQNKTGEAGAFFDQAIAVDGALGNAWLGRGLSRIRQGDKAGGRQDLQVAATLEPHRSALRSYLGKAYQNEGDLRRAQKELELAKRYDPNDPTAWLYSALLLEQQNQVNEAVRNLERSQDLNDNRSVFRSRMLLDQDQAVRSANLARIYQDAGMTNYSIREASRAVNLDYANYSAHLFLANSYDVLRDPRQVNLRYETPWLGELLVANLLAPVGAGVLSPNISQQEFSRFFEGNRLGVSSTTEYLSRGHWFQSGSQFGTFGNTGYSIDATYRSENGWRPNADVDSLTLSAQIKQQITEKDSIFIQAVYYDFEAGDVAQYYNQASASQTQRIKENQEPNLFVGYHHEWEPGSHTLFLFSRLDDTLRRTDSANPVRFLTKNGVGNVTAVTDRNYGLDYVSEFEGYSSELQQIWQKNSQTFIVGGRYQTGWSETDAVLTRTPSQPAAPSQRNVETDLDRISIYGYHIWEIVESLQLTTGLSYDRLEYPENIDIVPVIESHTSTDQVSPKVGLVWSPFKDTFVRGYYAQSLGGLFFDTSVRIEPVQIAGFTQAFRSLIPESVRGLIPGTEFETYGVGVDHKFETGTYVTLEGQILNSTADRSFGVYDAAFLRPPVISSTPEQLEFQEKSALLTIDQLLGKEWSIGASYRLSEATLANRFTRIPNTVALSDMEVSALINQVSFHTIYNLPCGFFSQFQTLWTAQSNYDYIPELSGDNFWHLNLYVGYRFPKRHAEIRVGLLNILDEDYELNPLNLYSELPRERTFAARLRFNF